MTDIARGEDHEVAEAAGQGDAEQAAHQIGVGIAAIAALGAEEVFGVA